MTPVFIGIDVACAKGKRLPICFARSMGGQLEPLEMPRSMAGLIPRGLGNRAVSSASPFVELAARTTTAIQTVCENMGWKIERIAIDAPAAPATLDKRGCETALIAAGLSVFTTPSSDEWLGVLSKCRAHLNGGGSLACLPYANKIWMLYGFELFTVLRRAGFDVIETYPFAIAHGLLGTHAHKSTAEGYSLQLNAIAERIGWNSSDLEARLRATVSGTRQDRLDAFMAAWVASLPRAALKHYGDANDPADAIWVPA